MKKRVTRSESITRPTMTKKLADEKIDTVYSLIKENPDLNEDTLEVIFRANSWHDLPYRIKMAAYDVKLIFEYDREDLSLWVMQASVDEDISGIGVELYNAPVHIRKRCAFFIDELREHLLKGTE